MGTRDTRTENDHGDHETRGTRTIDHERSWTLVVLEQSIMTIMVTRGTRTENDHRNHGHSCTRKRRQPYST